MTPSYSAAKEAGHLQLRNSRDLDVLEKSYVPLIESVSRIFVVNADLKSQLMKLQLGPTSVAGPKSMRIHALKVQPSTTLRVQTNLFGTNDLGCRDVPGRCVCS